MAIRAHLAAFVSAVAVSSCSAEREQCASAGASLPMREQAIADGKERLAKLELGLTKLNTLTGIKLPMSFDDFDLCKGTQKEVDDILFWQSLPKADFDCSSPDEKTRPNASIARKALTERIELERTILLGQLESSKRALAASLACELRGN